MVDINFKKLEQKWQKKWKEAGIFAANDNSKKKNYYVLEMFPYPSGSGLHMGHAWNYTIGDILARFKLMNGFNVLHPMGYDALGLPAENAAIKDKINPEDYTKKAIKNYIKQQQSLGLSYDWNRVVVTSDSSYYKWDQWIFLKMLQKGLAYQRQSNVNWCPSCCTVLANEQAQNGKCDRCDTKVEIKNLKQWFLKITDYADELYEEIDKLKDWPERTKLMQKNWIGKSYGTEIDFEIDSNKKFGNVVIVHGGDLGIGVEFDKHWFLEVKSKLEKKGIKVDLPAFPIHVGATYSDWKKIFEKLNVNENTILIGHSRGTAFLVRWIGENKKKIKKLILVAPWKFADKGYKEVFYNFEIDSSIRERVERIVYFTSNDEEDEGKKSLKVYQKVLGGEIIELKNHGHFTEEDMGTKEFPELLNEIIVNEKFLIFTTRPDTIFGVTFMVISAQHSKLWDLVTAEQKKEVEKFLSPRDDSGEPKKLKSVSEKDLVDMEKEGVFTGSYAINPANGERVPIYAGNFVVADYGSGMVMAVPAHDQRDFEFAKKYGIEIKQVIEGELDNKAYTGSGILINSEQFNSLDNEDAKEEITEWLTSQKKARKVVNFRLRDWGISRQRYWGTPIPIIHCGDCGAVPVLEKDLPVKLPKDVKFGKGNPLETNGKWIKAKCPKCGKEGKRETDTMDTFVNSSWYFMRYCDSQNVQVIFDKKKVANWCPVDSYIGGAEHACMHLIYTRFYTKFLRDLGLINFGEPIKRLFHQGMLHAEGGGKMSKSKGSVVLPEKVSDVYGIDTARFFLSSLASPDKDIDWSEKGIVGSLRFINKLMEFDGWNKKDSEKLLIKLNNVIKNISEYYENFGYRKATIELRELFDLMSDGCSKNTFEVFLKLLNPICPHITEELWEKIGEKSLISNSSWPLWEEKNLKVLKKELDLNSKVIELVKGYMAGKEIKKIYLYVLPFEIDKLNLKILEKAFGKKVEVYSVKDEKKHDPQGKSKKARPGMPGVWFE